MAQRYKPPVNFRAVPSRTVEAFDISGGFALLAEAPADPTNGATPLVVTVNGFARSRAPGVPGVGEYRVLTQAVIGADGQSHTEWLPVLQFNAADEGQSGSADYYRTGTVLTAEWYAALLAFVTPLVVNTEPELPAPTMDATLRGRPGDTAYVGGAIYFSDGLVWNKAGAAVGASASLLGSIGGVRAVLNGSITTAIRLAGAMSGAASVAGTFNAPAAALAGSADAGPAVTTGALTTAIRLAGAITAAATETGGLTTGIPLAGAIAVNASAVSAALTTGVGTTPTDYACPALDAQWCASYDDPYAFYLANELRVWNNGDDVYVAGATFAVPSDPGGVTSATLTLEKTTAGAITVRVYGRKVTSQPAWASTGPRPGDTPKTTAYVDWSVSSGTGLKTSPNLVSIWNELKAQAGWTWGTSRVALTLEDPIGIDAEHHFSAANAAVTSGNRPKLSVS